MTDTLQAEVERRMRSHADAMPGGGHELCLEDAVAVAVEMVEERHRKWFARNHQNEKRAAAAERALAEHREKWGHARRCQCWNPIVGIFRDPRCAPAPEEKA